MEVCVLGALVEKDITTPQYYPLSLNALVNACNQKSNRDPVMKLEEDAVRQALVRSAGGNSRVAKFEHRLNELYKLCSCGRQKPGDAQINLFRPAANAFLITRQVAN